MLDISPPRILSIAGSDSSGGAGVQADIKTITMLNGYAMTAITAITAQNSMGVDAIKAMPGELVAAQIKACVDDIGVDAIKIGMLPNCDVIEAVAHALMAIDAPIILDPVMVATSGATLIETQAITAMQAKLFPMAKLITPNRPELEYLSGGPLSAHEDMAQAATQLATHYGASILAKGGHSQGDQIIDTLIEAPNAETQTQRTITFEHARLDTRHTHGTGCTLSAAIATMMGHQKPLDEAVLLARKFVFSAIKHAPGFGAGHGPLGHQAVRNL